RAKLRISQLLETLLVSSLRAVPCVSYGAGGHTSRDIFDWKAAKSIYEFTVTDIEGNDVSLEKYRGLVCIITNLASK
uniref:Uncharacterized protein n=1 Tax=Callorhinchus milii TaxID=7868 RepID=A0A4W3IIV3_CALMI